MPPATLGMSISKPAIHSAFWCPLTSRFGYHSHHGDSHLRALMPEISRFFGIVVRMYLNDHGPPHFHARYGSFRGRIRITPVEALDGDLPPRPLAMVLEWARLHEAELMECWLRVRAQKHPRRIAPLE